MTKYNGLQVTYTHPAIPPMGIEVGKVYVVNATKEKIFIVSDRNEELTITEYLLKELYSLVNGEWMDFEFVSKEK